MYEITINVLQCFVIEISCKKKEINILHDCFHLFFGVLSKTKLVAGARNYRICL